MTKRILALALVLICCAFPLFSCGEEEVDGIAVTQECYSNSLPTKIVTNSLQEVLDDKGKVTNTLTGSYVTTVGKIGGKNAAVRTYEQETLDTVNAGAGSFVSGPIKVQKGIEEYLEGYGLRTNGGDWKSKGLNFAPAMGTIAIKFTAADVTNVKYTEGKYDNVLTFTVPHKNIEKIFGYDYNGNDLIEADSNVYVEIHNNGAVVTSVTIFYSIDASVDFPARDITLTTTYSYDVEKIEIATGEK